MNDKGMPDLRINGERLISSIREMGAVGFDPETGGRTRLALTDADKKAVIFCAGGCTRKVLM